MAVPGLDLGRVKWKVRRPKRAMRRAPLTHAVLHTRPLRVTALPTPALAWPLQDTHDTQ